MVITKLTNKKLFEQICFHPPINIDVEWNKANYNLTYSNEFIQHDGFTEIKIQWFVNHDTYKYNEDSNHPKKKNKEVQIGAAENKHFGYPVIAYSTMDVNNLDELLGKKYEKFNCSTRGRFIQRKKNQLQLF